ncbi:hypothetical protein WR25_02252 isoform B [Diploscapter pachys]|uniref:MPN domain-containing protein n=1 Tax=Diploscapter pachys TaxID=2018661 RepID=A0A2A2LET6_9BILA|nr:hypothetical protein WR25_02252 isoform B [Diploscapter pachys]
MVVEALEKDKIDEVDTILAAESGQIERGKDPMKCRHAARQKCSNCLPLDPYDEEYLKSKDIKHMSFHAHVRKLTAGHGRGTTLTKPLENTRYSINLSCANHKPYPKGICTKCKPPIATLNRQPFRHVDNISIENQELVNSFLDYWRRSGNQRVGILIGKYQAFTEVPLGIKATVAAIYEPPQVCKSDSVQLLDDPNEETVDKLSSWLGLKKVGWIFTDLWPADISKGTVHCTRNASSFLLSAEECITAGWLQNKHPNITQYSNERKFGSKFVTVVASGDENMHVNFHGYQVENAFFRNLVEIFSFQVSNQCAALVEANILCPTMYHPELAFIRETPVDEHQFITDVNFVEKNEYGADIQKNGRPLPVEYLLVDVPAGMPKDPCSTFYQPKHVKFHIENRTDIGETQGGKNLLNFCEEFSINQFLEQATNFHFLLYLLTNEFVKFTDDEIKSLCRAVASQDRSAAMDWANENVNWQQLVALSRAVHDEQGTSAGQSFGGGSAKWACKNCTFENTHEGDECSVCGLPGK